MKILKLDVHDIKRIKVAEITPTSNIVEIAGNNGQGKTTILDSILWALGGKDFIQDVPVRKGADEGTIEIDLGDYVVKRIIKPDRKTTITVSNKDGAKYSSPQELLNKIVTVLSFEPLEFLKKSDKERLKMVRSFDTDTDYDDLEKKIKDAEVLRRDLKRDLDMSSKTMIGLGELPPIPDLIQTKALQEKLDNVEKHNQEVRDMKRSYEEVQTTKKNYENDLSETKRRIESLEKELKEAKLDEERLNGLVDEYSKQISEQIDIPEFQNSSDILNEISEANQNNARRDSILQQHEDRQKIKSRHDELSSRVDKAENSVQKTRADLHAALSKIQIPVPGLEITPDGILHDGVPLEQSSDAQQLQVGIEIAIKANPKLRAIRIRDGSLLDDAAMEMLKATATQNDFQIWIERVGRGGEDAIVIEDGLVKSSPEPMSSTETKDMFSDD